MQLTTRNITIILSIIASFLIILVIILLISWRLFAASAPTPAPTLAFMTITPTPAPTTLTPSPTLIPSPIPTATPLVTGTEPVVPSPTPTNTPGSGPTPQAIINGPGGFVNVRSGPGPIYSPPLGTYSNGTVVDVIGKQYSTAGELWWLISFPAGPYGQGWVFADYTEAKNVDDVPWVAIPPTPTPFTVTPTTIPRPHAIVDSPNGFLYVRRGPGLVYEPPLGVYNNGAVVNIIGKQIATDGALWWLIPFASDPGGRGWIYADYTLAKSTENVPWVTAPPTPTPTGTSTPPTPSMVNWTVTGRVVDLTTNQAVVGASVKAVLGNDGTLLTTLTDSNGDFSIVSSARDSGNLILTVIAQGYLEKTITAGPVTPRVYNFPRIELAQQSVPIVTWAIFGRVVEIGTTNSILGARVEAILGDDAIHLETFSGANGEFSLNGQASDKGKLSLNITADGYQPFSFTSDQTDSRIYNLSDLQLVPIAGSCAYESVINLSQTSAIARLQSLSFTNVSTTSVTVGGNQDLIGRVLAQDPDPPPEGQSKRLGCQIPIILGVGVNEESQ
jgi:hypothetical protein